MICVQYEFVNGSRVDEVNLVFESINRNHSISDNVSDINELIYTRCYSNIPSDNNYTLYVCDGPSLDTCSTNPTTVLTNITIIGPSTSSTSHSYYYSTNGLSTCVITSTIVINSTCPKYDQTLTISGGILV